MATIAERIVEGMELRNLRQVDIIEKTGINKGALSSYISGRYKPKQTNIFLLAQALNVNEAWLMGADVPMERNESDVPEVNPDAEKNTLSDREQSHIQVYRDLSDGGKDKVDHYTDTVKSMERQESDSDIVDRFRKRFVARNGNKNLSPDQMQAIMDILDEEDDD